MKPTKMRNSQLYRATWTTKNSQVSSPLSKDLQKKYTKKSIRVVSGDSVKVIRGEYKGVDGKISKVAVDTSRVAIEGIKNEKTRGDKFDVYIHTSNIVVTDLSDNDQWRMKKIHGQKGTPTEMVADKGEVAEASLSSKAEIVDNGEVAESSLSSKAEIVDNGEVAESSLSSKAEIVDNGEVAESSLSSKAEIVDNGEVAESSSSSKAEIADNGGVAESSSSSKAEIVDKEEKPEPKQTKAESDKKIAEEENE